MNLHLKLPHWMIILFTSLAAIATAASAMPQFAEYAPVLAAVAILLGAAAGTTGVVSHSAVVATPSPPGSTTGHSYTSGMQGFAEGRALIVLGFLSLLGAGCAGLFAVAPAIGATAVCVYDFIRAHPGLTLLEYTAQATLACGGDALGILDALIASKDPALAGLKTEATQLRDAGGPRLQTFVMSAHARVGALRAERAPGGSR